MASLWADTNREVKFESLKENIKTEVLVIGGGMAGILAAYMLQRAGVECVLVDSERICSATTQNTTAKITLQHGLIYDRLIRSLGKEKAALYLHAQQNALDKYRELSGKLDFDFETRDSYVYSRVNLKNIEREIDALNSLGVKADFSDGKSLPFSVMGAVRVPGQAQFNPLKFAFSIAKDLPIYENTKVTEVGRHKVLTQHGEISCEKIIVATHFPFINKHGSYFLKMYQHRSYVLALEGAENIDGMWVDEDEKGYSLRSYGDFLLFGGGAHRTGKRGGGYNELERAALACYPNSNIKYRWAAQDCMTLDKMAYIGRYSSRTPDLYVATGFNKWGMTSSMLSAMILCDMICGKENEYAQLFSPSRSMLHPQLFVNVFEAAAGLLRPTVPRCPHLGCALKYNAAEHSWDCSCHGSRFSESGELLNNPATDAKKNMPKV